MNFIRCSVGWFFVTLKILRGRGGRQKREGGWPSPMHRFCKLATDGSLLGTFKEKYILFQFLGFFISYHLFSQSLTVKKIFSWKARIQLVKVLRSVVVFALPPLSMLCFSYCTVLWQCSVLRKVSSMPSCHYFFWKNPMMDACLAPLLALALVFFWLFFSSGLLPATDFAGKGSLGGCLVVWAAASSSVSEYDSLS